MQRPAAYRNLLGAILEEGGQVALGAFGRVGAQIKGDGSEVTSADRAAERVIVTGLARSFPDAGIVSEEGAVVPSGDGSIWYVDPIDGTSAFLEGLAYWGPTVCLVREGRLEVGAMWFPRLRELWFAERGQGAWRGPERLSPSADAPLDKNSSLYAPSRFHRRMPIPWPGKMRALGSTAAHLAHVASGGAAMTLVSKWEIWDVGCGILLVEEAGRRLSDLTGGQFEPMQRPGEPFLAGTPTAIRTLTGNES